MAGYISKIAEKKSLGEKEAYGLCVDMLKGSMDPIEISAILMGLRVKGEEPQEIRGFVKALRDNAVRVKAGGVIDIVGTGGDGLNTVNASTLASIVVASIGVPVAKHGNRGFSSLVGSADLMEALGYPIEHGADVAEELLKLEGFAYLYAPKYHGALKIVAPVRKKLGIRTIFNLAAPLANPANPRFQVIGVPSHGLLKLISIAMEGTGLERFAVVTGYPGMDELSPLGPSVAIIKRGSLDEVAVSPETLGLKRVEIRDISGQSRDEIIEKGVRGLKGEDRAVASFIAINAAMALYIAGEADSIREGYERAYREIESGSAWRKLNRVIDTARRLAKVGSG